MSAKSADYRTWAYTHLGLYKCKYTVGGGATLFLEITQTLIHLLAYENCSPLIPKVNCSCVMTLCPAGFWKELKGETLSLLWPSSVRDVGRRVCDERRRIRRQRGRGSDLKPKKTLLLLDLLPRDKPGAEKTAWPACLFIMCYYPSSMLETTVTL